MDMLGQGFTLSGAQAVFGSSFMQPPGKLLCAAVPQSTNRHVPEEAVRCLAEPVAVVCWHAEKIKQAQSLLIATAFSLLLPCRRSLQQTSSELWSVSVIHVCVCVCAGGKGPSTQAKATRAHRELQVCTHSQLLCYSTRISECACSSQP